MNRIWDLGKFAGNTALQDEAGKTLTYAELEREGRRLAEQFPERSLVFILCRNEIGSVVGYTACVNSGAAVPVMLSAGTEYPDAKEYEDLLKTCGLTAPQMADRIENALAGKEN